MPHNDMTRYSYAQAGRYNVIVANGFCPDMPVRVSAFMGCGGRGLSDLMNAQMAPDIIHCYSARSEYTNIVGAITINALIWDAPCSDSQSAVVFRAVR